MTWLNGMAVSWLGMHFPYEGFGIRTAPLEDPAA